MERDLIRQSHAVDWHRVPHNGRDHSITSIHDLKRRASRRRARAGLRYLAEMWSERKGRVR